MPAMPVGVAIARNSVTLRSAWGSFGGQISYFFNHINGF